MSKGENGISAYDYSNLESILLDGIVLTNPLVDYIHGVLPESTSDEKEKRLQDLFLGILDMGEEIASRCNLAHSPPEPESESWHHLCQMRRILGRISGSLNGKFHRNALINGKHGISVNSLVRLRQLRSKIITTIIQCSKQTLLDITEGKKIHWNSIATAYESAIILRGKGDIGAAIDLASKTRNSGIKIIPPTKSDSITGLISFNYRFWEGVNEYDEEHPDDLFSVKSSPQGNLMALSEIVSRNSLYAASRRLNTNHTRDQMNLFKIVGHIDTI